MATEASGGGSMVAILHYMERMIWVNLRKFVLDYLITLATTGSIIYLDHLSGQSETPKKNHEE